MSKPRAEAGKGKSLRALRVTAKASKREGQLFWFGPIWTNRLFELAS